MRHPAFAAMIMLSTPALAAEKPWFEGGTLQKATVAEWQKASAENRLATAGDFVASISSISDLAAVKDPAKMAQIRKSAEELVSCVDDMAAKNDGGADQPVAQLVVMCTVLKR